MPSCSYCYRTQIDITWLNVKRIKLHKSDNKREKCDVVCGLRLKLQLNKGDIFWSGSYVNCLFVIWPTDTPGRFNLHLSNSVHEICSAHWTRLIPQALLSFISKEHVRSRKKPELRITICSQMQTTSVRQLFKDPSFVTQRQTRINIDQKLSNEFLKLPWTGARRRALLLSKDPFLE